MKNRSIIRGMLVLLFLAGVASAQTNLKKVSFIPLWSPQAQFAGYYVAYEKGFYRDHGLDVKIIQGGPKDPPDQLLKSGKADFGIMWLSAGIRERAHGIPFVNIAQITQRSALMLVAKKSSGINSPRDMNGKKIGVWEGDLSIQPKAFIKKYKLHIEIVPQGYTVNLFLRGGVDVASAMWYNEYNTVINSGVNKDELTTFFYYDYGLNFPEDGIYTMSKTAAKDPEECSEFVKASFDGWKYAFTHEGEALDIVLKYMRTAGVPANRVHQKWMLEKMIDLMKDGSGKITWTLNEKDYERVASELAKFGDIKSIPEFGQFYEPAIQK